MGSITRGVGGSKSHCQGFFFPQRSGSALLTDQTGKSPGAAATDWTHILFFRLRSFHSGKGGRYPPCLPHPIPSHPMPHTSIPTGTSSGSVVRALSPTDNGLLTPRAHESRCLDPTSKADARGTNPAISPVSPAPVSPSLCLHPALSLLSLTHYLCVTPVGQ